MSSYFEKEKNRYMIGHFLWWLLPDSNWGHAALQAAALPAELKSHGKTLPI